MEGTDPKVIGSRILECRKKLKYSREKLAEAADVSNSFLAEIEHGTKAATGKWQMAAGSIRYCRYKKLCFSAQLTGFSK
mgnify:CR=1 FL=1